MLLDSQILGDKALSIEGQWYASVKQKTQPWLKDQIRNVAFPCILLAGHGVEAIKLKENGLGGRNREIK